MKTLEELNFLALANEVAPMDTETSPPQRIGWGIQISGEQFDIDDWEQQLSKSSNPKDCWVERVTLADGGVVVVLRSPELDSAASQSDAWIQGKAIHAAVEAVLQVMFSTCATRLEGVLEFFDIGSPSRHLIMEITEGISIRARVGAILVRVDGKRVPPSRRPKRTHIQKAVRLCAGKPLLAKALQHFKNAGKDDWGELFNSFEALGDAIGGNIVANGWSSDEDATRFSETCHHYRHHRRRLPDRSMNFSEAKNYMKQLLNKALDHPWR